MEGYEDDTDPDLDISKLKDSVWLVKVPKFIYDQWKNADETDTPMDLGKVRIENNDFNNLRLILNDNAANKDLPKEYHINMVNKTPTGTFVFSEEPIQTNEPQVPSYGGYQPKISRTAIVGTVAHECSLTPILSDAYRNLLSNRRTKAEMPTRQIQRLEAPQHSSNTALLNSHNKFSGFISKKRMPHQMTPDKGIRMEKSELLDELFMRFEEYEYWTLKGLREVSKQPEAWLKEVLNEVGVLIKKGPYALKWTLKPEYKNAKGKTSQYDRESSIDAQTPDTF